MRTADTMYKLVLQEEKQLVASIGGRENSSPRRDPAVSCSGVLGPG